MTTAAVDERPTDTMTTTPPDERPVHLAKCAECSQAVRFRPSTSGASFTIVDADPDMLFGIGENGRPICPNGHGEMAIADDQLKPVPEAFADATTMLQTAEREAVQRTLPGVVPVFNFQGCYMELEQQAVVVEALQKEYEDDARVAKDSKKRWDEAEEKFTKMALEFRRRRQAKDEGAIDPTDTGARSPRHEGCTWEAKHPGETCPLCANEVAESVIAEVLGNPSKLPPADAEAHVLSVDLINAWVDVQELEASLTLQAHTYLPSSEIASWLEPDRKAVLAYLAQQASIAEGEPVAGELLARPDILGRPHIPEKAQLVDGGDAYAPQHCTICGVELPNYAELDHYEETDLVGTDCKGAKGKKKASKKKAKA